MPPQDAAVPTEYPARLGRTARRELAVHGFTRYDQLTRLTARELLRIHGVGPKAIRILTEELAARGLAFAVDRAVDPARSVERGVDVQGFVVGDDEVLDE